MFAWQQDNGTQCQLFQGAHQIKQGIVNGRITKTSQETAARMLSIAIERERGTERERVREVERVRAITG